MLRLVLRNFTLNKRIIIAALFILTVVLYFFNFQLIISHNPSPPYVARYDLKSAKHLIENLCELYNDPKNPLILGSMCSDLCQKRGKFETYKSFKLSGRYNPEGREEELKKNKGAGNKAYFDYKSVLVYENRHNSSIKFVLKSRKKYFLDVDTHMDFDFAEQNLNSQLDFLMDYITTTLKSKFNIDIDNTSSREWLRLFKKNPQLAVEKIDKYADKEDLNYYVRLFYLDEFKTYLRALSTMDNKLMARFVTNLIVLTGQDEYLFYKLFHSKPGVLKVNGSCGHFYMTEYVDNLENRIGRMSTRERKSLALQFLALTHSLDTAYLVNRLPDGSVRTTPIQFCDIKLDNFGLDQNGQLKIMDTDTAFPDSYIFNPRRCSTHDDCHFFDCMSYCNPTTQKCSLTRINNNLQAFCHKIFNNSNLPLNGILSGVVNFGSNIHSEILSRLQRCQSPGFYQNTDIPIGTNESISRSLSILLQHDGL